MIVILEEQRLFNIEYIKSISVKTKTGKNYLSIENWNGLCVKCSISSDIKEYQLRNHDYICRTCNQIKLKLDYLKNKAITKSRSIKQFKDKTKDSRRNQLATYRSRDKIRYNEICDYSFDDFVKILSNPCFYCKIDDACGLDRIDNSKGHVKNNTVPCCYHCNTARMDNFSFEEMKELGLAIREIKLARRKSGVAS